MAGFRPGLNPFSVTWTFQKSIEKQTQIRKFRIDQIYEFTESGICPKLDVIEKNYTYTLSGALQ